MDAKNELTGPDSTLFKNNIFNKLNNGICYSIPISGSFKVFKYFTWSNTINYTERWYFKRIHEDSLFVTNTQEGKLKI